MIYTVTLNPSLDYTAAAATMNFGKTNRTKNEYIVPGGKGLNVSVMLSRLGLPTTALGFAAGFTGKELLRLLKDLDCSCDFIETKNGFTRINVKLVSEEVTEFNGSGITLDEDDLDALKNRISKLQKTDTLVLSGSIPNGADRDIYKQLILSAPKGVTVVLDTCGEPLASALECRPFLIKPNIDELRDLFREPIETLEDILFYAKKLQSMGAQNVLISMGADGALLLTEGGESYHADVPKGECKNTVGAGDSMIAGFLYGFTSFSDYEKALKYAVAAGSATAYAVWLAEKPAADALYQALSTPRAQKASL